MANVFLRGVYEHNGAAGRICFADKFPDNRGAVVFRVHLRDQLVAVRLEALELPFVCVKMVRFFVYVPL